MALSEKKAITDKKHHEKLDRIVIQPYKEHGAAIRAAADAAGESLQRYVLEAVDQRMKHDAEKACEHARERAAVERADVQPTQRPAPPIPAADAEEARKIDDLDVRKQAMIDLLRRKE